MKIVHVIDSSGVWGAEKMLFALVREQQSRGDFPLVLSLGKPGEDKKQIEQAMDELGIAYAAFRLNTLPRITQLKELLRKIRVLAPEILHSHGYKGDILLGSLKPFLQVPLVSTLHGWTTLPGRWTKLRLYELIHVHMLPAIDAVVIVSPGIKKNPLFARVRSAVKKRVIIIENGIPASEGAADVQAAPALQQFVQGADIIGSIGRMSEEKGYSLLIAAFSELARESRNLRLLLVGDGPERSNLEAAARRAGVADRVMITGYVENASSLLKYFDVYVCSSFTEGLPITLLEAMRARVPIVSTAISNIPDVLQRGEGGILVEAGSMNGLADALQAAIGDRSFAEEMAGRSYGHFLANFSSKTMADRYAAVYAQLIE